MKLNIDQIRAWITEKAFLLSEREISLLSASESNLHKPSVCADFEGSSAMGRVMMWTTGELELEVLDLDTGNVRYLRQATVDGLDDPLLNKLITEFAQKFRE